MLLLCLRSDVMPETVAAVPWRSLLLEDTGNTGLKHFPDGKEANHGGHSSVVDAGGLVRRVKLRHPLSVRVRTATHEQSLRRRVGLSHP